MTRARMGRPPLPKGEAREDVFTLRLNDEERRKLEVTARRAGKPVTQWAREVLLAATN